MKNKESLFYVITAAVSLAAIVFIIMICINYFQNLDNYSDVSETVGTSEETSETETFDNDSSSIPKKFFGVDVIEIG